MRLVHFSDLHVGFRQFDRAAPGSSDGVYGLNQREKDVIGTFHALIDQVIAIKPDLIVCGGDVLHSFRPSNGTILELTAGFSKLVGALPTVPVVIAAGNHDMPKTRETAVILKLLGPLGIRVADWDATAFAFPELDVSVLAVPEGCVRPQLTPDPAFKRNVLVMHGEVQGMPGVHGDRSKVEIPVDAIEPPKWDYIALGHYHVYQQLAPNMCYAGSIDYTSTNYWGELRAEEAAGISGKGFIERDLETGEQTFHALTRSREFVDLAVDAYGMSSEQLTDALRVLFADGQVDDAVARVVITDCERPVFREVDSKLLREFRKRALNLHFDVRRPEVVRAGAPGAGRGTRGVTLDEIITDFMAKRFPPGSDMSLEAITALSNKYMAAAGGGDDPTPALEASIAASVASVAAPAVAAVG